MANEALAQVQWNLTKPMWIIPKDKWDHQLCGQNYGDVEPVYAGL